MIEWSCSSKLSKLLLEHIVQWFWCAINPSLWVICNMLFSSSWWISNLFWTMNLLPPPKYSPPYEVTVAQCEKKTVLLIISVYIIDYQALPCKVSNALGFRSSLLRSKKNCKNLIQISLLQCIILSTGSNQGVAIQTNNNSVPNFKSKSTLLRSKSGAKLYWVLRG